MSTGIILPPEVKDNPFKKAAEEISSLALAVQQIATVEEYTKAGELYRQHASAASKIKDFYDPKVEAAHKPWKALTDERKGLLDALDAGKKHLGRLMSSYEAAEAEKARRLQQEAERKQREAEEQWKKELKAEEDRRLEAAQVLQEEGLHEQAEALLNQTPVQEPEPMPPPTPVARPAVPKVSGMSARSAWKGRLKPDDCDPYPAEVSEQSQMRALVILCKAIGEGKVPPQAVELSQSFINKQASSFKSLLNYPGIEVYEEKIRVGRS